MKSLLVFISNNIDHQKMKKFMGGSDIFLDVPCDNLEGLTTRDFITQMEDGSDKDDLVNAMKSIEERNSGESVTQDIAGHQNTPVINPGVIHNFNVINYKKEESEAEIDQVPVQALTGFIQGSEIVNILVEALAEEDITVEDLQSLPREELKSTFLTGFRKKRSQKAGLNISRTVAVISAFFLLILLMFQSWFV